MSNFNKIIGALCIGSLAVLTACGADKADKKQNAQPVTAAAAPKVEEAKVEMPQLLVAKVPVGADGQELNDQAETREIAVAGEMSEANVAGAFDSGSTVAVDEMDADTSTQQYHRVGNGNRRSWYWNTGWYPGKALGRGLWWGRNPYSYYGGVSYPYYYGNSYNYNGCNYYTYTPYNNYNNSYNNNYNNSYNNNY